jgi:RNA polymerase sigma factor (sigma-70 family)
MSDTDLQLLARYTRQNAEDAFAELVRRHLDLVFSAALRQVRSPQLAEEVAQSAFTDLARQAHRLAPDTILTAWLYQVTRRTAIDVVRREARRQLLEQVACELNAMNTTAADWTHIEPLLDEAMHALDDTDRTAVLLRYFENKSLREVGQTLGTNEDAARKRVSRAVERLREFFAKRGVTVGASGLVVVISANAIQAAPAGLAVTISTAAALAGTSIAATATATATIAKAIAMTALQKTLITTALVLAVGAGIYEARQAARLRDKVQTLQQQQAPLAEQIQQLQRQRDEAKKRLATLADAIANVKGNSTELLKLRAEVTRLRGEASQANDPFVQTALAWKVKKETLQKLFAERPDQRIPEMQLLGNQEWLDIARDQDLESDIGIRKALSAVRKAAKNNFASMASAAVAKYSDDNSGGFPTDLSQLQRYFKAPVDEAILQRYEILPAAAISNVGLGGKWVITEKAAVDPDYDNRWSIGPGSYGSSGWSQSEVDQLLTQLAPAIKAFSAANNGSLPKDDPSQLLPFITTPDEQAALQKLTQKAAEMKRARNDATNK